MIRRVVKLPMRGRQIATAVAAQLPQRLTRSYAQDALSATCESPLDQQGQTGQNTRDRSLNNGAQSVSTHKHKRKKPWHPIVGTPRPNPAQANAFSIAKSKVRAGSRITVDDFDREGNPVNRNIPAFWLRDHCQCEKCVHPVTKQREVDTFSIPYDIYIIKADMTGDEIRVTFSDCHESTFKKDALAARVFNNHQLAAREGDHDPILWGSEIKDRPPMVAYDKVMASDEGVKEWTYLIKRYGFCYVDGCPVTPEATQELLERISFIRHSHYGGFWDFTADMASNDTAYTNMGLGAHTDTTYFTNPVRLQMFHLLSHEQGSGGASLLVDGFKVALDLYEKKPTNYNTLMQTKLYSHASGNEGNSIFPSEPQPVFVHRDPQSPQLLQVRWNNYDRDLLQAPMEKWPHWYEAARMWNQMLNSDKNEYWEQLQPGRPLIFDNWRVLHGRSAFTGQRRLCGGYINDDDFRARYRALNFPNKGLMPWQV